MSAARLERRKTAPGVDSVVGRGAWPAVGRRFGGDLLLVGGAVAAVAFGSGLGYTTFEIDDVPATAVVVAGDGLTFDVSLTNTGGRRGSEVVQIYIEPVDPTVQRPIRELKAFRKLELDPGTSATVSFELSARDFAYYDPSDLAWPELVGNRFVPAGAGALHRTQPGWYVDPGRYRVWVGRSSRELRGAIEVEVTGESTLLVDPLPSRRPAPPL